MNKIHLFARRYDPSVCFVTLQWVRISETERGVGKSLRRIRPHCTGDDGPNYDDLVAPHVDGIVKVAGRIVLFGKEWAQLCPQ